MLRYTPVVKEMYGYPEGDMEQDDHGDYVEYQSPEESRALFEAYLLHGRPRASLSYDLSTDCYLDNHVQRHWWTWQHARGERNF